MATQGYPGTFPGITTTISYRSIGAVQQAPATSLGYPGTFNGITTTISYRTIGAVMKAATVVAAGGASRYRCLGLALGLGLSRRSFL